MEIIRKRITLFNNNTFRFEHEYSSCQIVDEIPKSENVKITWDNLSDIYSEYSDYLPFTIFNFKKGKVISFFSFQPFNKDTWDIKEWKKPDLNMSLQIDYLLATDVSIETVLRYRDLETAIKFLNEKGLQLSYEKVIKLN